MFKLTKKVDLSKFGWEGCVLEFDSPSYSEMTDWQGKVADTKSTEAAVEIVDMVQSKFVKGNGIDENGKRVEVTKENFSELPFEVVLECVTQISGGAQDPNL